MEPHPPGRMSAHSDYALGGAAVMAERDGLDRRRRTVRVAVVDDGLTAGQIWQQLADAGIRSMIRTHDVLGRPGHPRQIHYRYEIFVLESDTERATVVLGGEIPPGSSLASASAEPRLTAQPQLDLPRAPRPRTWRERTGLRATALAAPPVLVALALVISLLAARDRPPRQAILTAPATVAAPAPDTSQPPAAEVERPAPSVAGVPTPAAAPRSGSDLAFQPIESTFVVTTAPVDCNQDPNAGAALVVQHQPGAVRAMDAVITQPDGIWQRETERGCWTRISRAPVSVFANRESAECFAVAFRRPPPLVANCVKISTVTGAPPGGLASLLARAPPGATCTSNSLTVAAGTFRVHELGSRSADDNGWIYWSWEVHPDTPPGMSTVTVTCIPGGTDTTTLAIG
jgi:hypothetical protein